MAQDDDLENDVDSSDAAGDLASNTMPPPMTSSMKMPSPAMDPMLKDYLDNKQKLAAAQDQASRNEMLTGLARAGTSLSAGLAHSNQPVDDSPFKAMAATDQAPVQAVLNEQKSQSTQLQNQKDLMANEKQAGDEDPTSVQSKAAQTLIKNLYPGKFDNATLETMSKAQIGDSIMKPLELDEKIKEHADEMKNKAADRAGAAADRAVTKATEAQNKAKNYVVDKLESARGDQAVKQAQVDLYAAKKVDSLIGMYPDPNQMTNEQVRNLAMEIAKIAQGGVPGQHELDGITPNTLTGRMATIVQNLTNHPTAANAGEFVKQFQQYSNAISKDARSTIKDKIDSITKVKRQELGEENYELVKSSYYTRFGLGDDAGTAGAAGDDHPARALKIMAERKAARANGAPQVNLPNYSQPQMAQPSPMLPQPPPQDGYAEGGTVRPDNRLMPDPERARQAAAGAEKGETFSDGWQNLKNELGIGKPNPPPARNYANGGTVQNFQHGGSVPGLPKVPFNSPVNDTVMAKLTPREEVLPLSVTQSHSPSMAAYLHMKTKGYK